MQRQASFDLLPRDARAALEVFLEIKSDPHTQEALADEWATLLGRAIAALTLRRTKLKPMRALYDKIAIDQTEKWVRSAFDYVLRISYYATDSANAVTAIRFLQLCDKMHLNLPFIPTPDHKGLLKIVEHYECSR